MRRIRKNQYGFIKQKGNRYFINFGATTIYNSGFKTKKQFNDWLDKEFKKYGLDWRAGYTWKYRNNEKVFNLVKYNGEQVK